MITRVSSHHFVNLMNLLIIQRSIKASKDEKQQQAVIKENQSQISYRPTLWWYNLLLCLIKYI